MTDDHIFRANEDAFLNYDDEAGGMTIDMTKLNHLSFESPTDHTGVKRVVARGNSLSPIQLGFGGFYPWSGDWSEAVGSTTESRRAHAPIGAQWIFSQGLIGNGQLMLNYIDAYRNNVSLIPKIRAGVIHTGSGTPLTVAMLFDGEQTYHGCTDQEEGTQLGNILTFGLIMHSIESIDNGNLMSSFKRQADTSNVKVVASPKGGDTHAQVRASQDKFQDRAGSGREENPMHMHSYSRVANVPSYGSTDTYDAGNVGLNGWWEASPSFQSAYETSGDPWNGDLFDMEHLLIAAPDAVCAEEIGSGPLDSCFPLFLTVDVNNTPIASYYQPHFLTGGDFNSAQILKAAGNSYSPNGGMASGANKATNFTSCFMQLKLPTVDSTNSFWISEMSDGYTGSYGVSGSNRAMHDLIVETHPQVGTHYETTKSKGQGQFSFFQFGPHYSGLPIAASDWCTTGFHANQKLRNFLMSFYSLNHSTFFENMNWGLEIPNFSHPFAAVQYEDFGGKGAQFTGNDIDAKGYRYGYKGTNLDAPKLAYADSRRLEGGVKNVTILPIPIPTGMNKVRLWDMKVAQTGLTLTAGRFASLALPTSGKTETYAGPLFLASPGFSANLYTSWIAAEDNECLATFTVRVQE